MKHDQTAINHTSNQRTAKKAAGLIAAVISSLLLVNVSTAADRQDTSANARARYEYEKSICNNGQSNQARETCLREAGAARQQAQLGTLTTASEDQLQRNRELRCNALPPADREYCLQRMRGEGTQSGSAQSGGISRELVVPVKPGQ